MLLSSERKRLQNLTTEQLNEMIEESPYRTREQAIGNNEIISRVFLILHERKEVDCETALKITITLYND